MRASLALGMALALSLSLVLFSARATAEPDPLVPAVAAPFPIVDGLPRAALSERYAIIVGSSRGLPGSLPLRFTSNDTAQVHRVLQELGGVPKEHLILLDDPTVEALRERLAGLEAHLARARDAGRPSLLLFYYSGHATAAGLEFGDQMLSLAELKAYLKTSSANLRFAILDACYSGAIVQMKGSRPAPAFAFEGLERASEGVSGYAILTSSGAAEVSQEASYGQGLDLGRDSRRDSARVDDEGLLGAREGRVQGLGGSVFTHYVLAGLRGGADMTTDGRVTLSELYAYTYRKSVRQASRGLPREQHPTIDLGLSGTGDPVLTDLRRARATVRVTWAGSVVPGSSGSPSGRSVGPVPVLTLVHRDDARGDYVIAELEPSAGEPQDLAVEEGRIDVYRRLGARVSRASVTVPAGGEVDIDTLSFEPVPHLAAHQKGPQGRFAIGLGAQGVTYLSSRVRDRLVGPLLAVDLSAEWRPRSTPGLFVLARVSAAQSGQSVTIADRQVDQTVSQGDVFMGLGWEWWWRQLRVAPWGGAGVLWARRAFSAVHEDAPGDQDSIQGLLEGGASFGWAPVRFGEISLVSSLGYSPFRQDEASVHQAYVRFGARASVRF